MCRPGTADPKMYFGTCNYSSALDHLHLPQLSIPVSESKFQAIRWSSGDLGSCL